MGCVSSKHLKQQASIDGWTSPASRGSTPRPKTITTSYSVESYHRHFVSLTSTSYGSLKIESPKPAEVKFIRDRAPFSSLNQMYGKLRTLEMVDSAHINGSCDISGEQKSLQTPPICQSPLQLAVNDHWSSLSSSLGMTASPRVKPTCDADTPKPSVYESPPQSIDSTELTVSETINVKEMMMGLEDAANSHGSSRAPSTLGTPNAKTSRNPKKRSDLMQNVGSGKKKTNGLAAEWNEFGKENTAPFHSQQQSTSPASHPPYEMASSGWYLASRSPLTTTSQPTYRQASSMDRAWDYQAGRKDSIGARRTSIGRGSPSGAIQISKSSPGLSSTSSTSARSGQYTPRNGKVKLTLQTQRQNDATTILTPSPDASRLKRLGLAGGSGLLESNSPTFDPDLVASYEKALKTVSRGDWNAASSQRGNKHSSSTTDAGRPFFWSRKAMPTAELDQNLYNPFELFERICPPGGEKAVVLYTTTLRGIRKTFDDCNAAREILESFGLSIDERDVSMHLEFLNELRELMGRVVSVPRMFIKGRYIGGIEEVVRLHETGKLSELVKGLPKQMNGGHCDGCGGVRFVPCLECSGSCKVRREEDSRGFSRCPDCNENGLIQCPICT